MHAGGILLTVDRPAAPSDYVASLRRRDRTFWIEFACAMCAHALLILGMLLNNSNYRTVGSPEGANDAIAVEIVDGATLKDSMEPPTPPTQPPGSEPQQQAARAQPQQPPQPPVEQPPPEPQVEPQPPAEAVPPPPTPEAAQPSQSPPTPDPAEKLAAEALPAFEEAPAADALQMPKPQEAPEKEAPSPEPPKEAQKAEPKKPPPQQQAKQQPQKPPQKQPQKRTQTSALDLAVPYDGAEADSDAGNSSAVQRPPGITRSGENDEFARNVIRALQKTMPHVRARSRVTVKIVLNENGSRADVKLMKSGGDPDLDFNVMFAARQTAYPFPPRNSTLVDRTFTVTYIYR